MVSIQELINQAVLKNQSLYKSSAEPKFHISDAGTCYRKRYFKRLGIPATREIPVASLRKMLAGEAAHESVMGLLKKHRKLFATELYVETDHIRGRFDAIVKDQEKSLLEIKSTEKWQMGKIKINGASKEHLIQMFTYWRFIRDDYKDLDQATLFYLKREDFEGKNYDFLWNEEIEQQVAKEWKPLIKYWIEQTIPDCTCHEDFGGKGQDYCMYNEGESCCLDHLMEEHNAEVQKAAA